MFASSQGQFSRGNIMSFYRASLAAFVALFASALTSGAFAQCGGCGWGIPAPVAYAAAPIYAPISAYSFGGCGCGGCGVAVAVTYAQPVAVQPAVLPVAVAPAPVAVDHWDTGGCAWGGCGGFGLGGFGSGGCGCGSCGGCGGSVVYAPAAPAVAPAPFYMVNQGPEYSGPGFMIPYGTYSPGAALAAPGGYPYVGTPGYRHYGYGYRMHPHYAHPYYRPYRHPYYPPRPLGSHG